ncbi:glutamate synthase [Marinomonas sp. SBI22]|uniref:FMN-binding glutamate synthase family protein n=1 Tax=unclassified Marinomonas TaxID=196814 RepID=UPI0007AFE06A|nr:MULTISPECIES: FMN-binding glutamate synthase family protein [unclassified Marinomonas]KZM44153.1 glutamate synthase [Marinomonas sp. SBI22]KZM45312.1 glutamate synthase [Marinomonas sp. SBI8L]
MTLMQICYWIIALLGNTITLIWFSFSGSGISLISLIFTLAYGIVGAYDIFYSPHSLNRLYPVTAYIRYFLENFRKEIHQYFVASETEELPFNREQRSLVYQRAKNVRDTIAFGTQRELLEENYLSLWHSLAPKEVQEAQQRVLIGGPDCLQPYSAAYLNVSAMSFGALSSQAIEALNLGAYKGNFSHNTGEGSVSPYHLKHGGDLVWQIGSGLFGCRTHDGDFCPTSFAKTATLKSIKMIEIKLSQGAKPGHGGVLPKAKITDEIAQVRGIPKNRDCVSPSTHPECQNPKALLTFIQKLRDLSEGKPIGFKLCLGNPAEFLSICKAMLEMDSYPDFITVDGAEGGTGAAPVEFSNRLGMTCLDAVYLTNSMLIGCGIRHKIKIIASGKTASSFDLLSKIAAGADTVNAARTMMMALGCIQSKSCNTNECPTGIATQDPVRGKAIDIEAKASRVANFQRNTLHSFFELVGSLGLEDPKKLTANMIKRRTSYSLSISLGVMIPTLSEGELITHPSLPYPWQQWWQGAQSDSFYVEDSHELPPPELKIKNI